jgi:hypothetical protein
VSNYLAAYMTPDGLEHWESVEVYGESWGCHQRVGSWKRCTVGELMPWHVWRYEEPSPIPGLMCKSAEVRKRLGVTALEGNGFYVTTTAKGGGA